jgi:hypothetical protein
VTARVLLVVHGLLLAVLGFLYVVGPETETTTECRPYAPGTIGAARDERQCFESSFREFRRRCRIASYRACREEPIERMFRTDEALQVLGGNGTPRDLVTGA